MAEFDKHRPNWVRGRFASVAPSQAQDVAARGRTAKFPFSLREKIKQPDVWFALVCLFGGVLFWDPLYTLVSLARHSDYYSHTLVTPLLAGYLVYRERKKIFSGNHPSLNLGIPLLLAGVLIYNLRGWGLLSGGREGELSMAIFSIVLFWIGGFALCYGSQAFRAALFPLLVLFLSVPLPAGVMEGFMHIIRVGSTEVAAAIFNLLGVPVFRDGFYFVLPGINIEIAKECSGIHSTLALFILSLIASHVFLRSISKKILVTLFVFPIVSLTNGLRIATVSLLAAYVDKSFLVGGLHRNGGIFFFLLAFTLLALVLRFFFEPKEINGSESMQVRASA
ncbi:MAG: exosortase/archaeosortase family protein, partial [Acidobacteriota bacterium]